MDYISNIILLYFLYCLSMFILLECKDDPFKQPWDEMLLTLALVLNFMLNSGIKLARKCQ